MKLLHPGKDRKNERGQTFVLLVMSLTVLLAFVGLAIDLGIAYVTKTTLSKAVDAAALVAMKDVNLGTGSLPNCSLTSGAGAAALEAFNVNYKSVPSLGTTPTPSICFSLDSNDNTIVNVGATATLNTYFIRVLGSTYDTLSVSASAQAQRNPLIMGLTLDVSYSMTHNGGSTALAPAVKAFIADFDPDDNDTTDWVSVVTFGTSAVVNLPNTQPLQGPVDTVMDTNYWPAGVTNATNSTAGLTETQSQILAKTLTPNTIRVAVFFTDGWPNIVQDSLECTKGSTTTTSVLFGGCDPGDVSLGLCGETNAGFWDPNTCGSDNQCSQTTCGATVFPDHETGADEEVTSDLYIGGTTPGSPSSSLPMASDAMYRALQVARQMQANNIYVYSIGMGTAITNSSNGAAEEFLREVANDPNSLYGYNPNAPIGEAVFASSSADLTQVFQEIASKILLRLSK